MKVHYCTAGAVLKLLLIVSVAYNCKEQSLNAEGRLDNIRNVLLVCCRIKILKCLTACFAVLCKVIVCTVGYAPKLDPTDRDFLFKV